MKKYNKSEIMSRAWELKRKMKNQLFSICLSKAWAESKENRKIVDRKIINKIISSFKPLMLTSTKEHFKLLNSKKGKAIMKRSDDDESKILLSNGLLFLSDIMKQRRFESQNFVFKSQNKKEKRNRIIDINKCEKINIDEYIRNT